MDYKDILYTNKLVEKTSLQNSSSTDQLSKAQQKRLKQKLKKQQTDALTMYCEPLLNEMLADPTSQLFAQPIDPSATGFESYTSIISSPMDFSTIQNKLQSKQYASVEEFFRDIDLIWDNCNKFFKVDSPITAIAQTIKEKWQPKLDSIKEQINKPTVTTSDESIPPENSTEKVKSEEETDVKDVELQKLNEEFEAYKKSSFQVLDEHNLNTTHVKIADFGNACWTFKKFTDDVQTRQYRAPEVIVGLSYSTQIDIWSLACMAFELVTGDYLFNPKDGKGYSRDEDHLALMMELLCGVGNQEMPKLLSERGKHSSKFFNKDGHLRHIKNLKYWGLKPMLQEKYVENFASDEEAIGFCKFLEPMLQLEKTQRATAAQMLQHPWILGMEYNEQVWLEHWSQVLKNTSHQTTSSTTVEEPSIVNK